MTDEELKELVKLYNPANAAALTPEQITGLQSLTVDQIKELAKAYPNKVFPRAYLFIKDSKGKIPMERQLVQAATFENLYNLITKNGLKTWVAVGFRGQTNQITRPGTVRVRRSEVVDLSDAELMTLPGFKLARTNGGEEVIPPEVVPVVKVKRGRPKVEKS